MGLLDTNVVELKKVSKASLTGKATRLLKQNGKRKKTRRSKGIKKKLLKIQERNKLMEQYKKQKKERGQMFKDFERLIRE